MARNSIFGFYKVSYNRSAWHADAGETKGENSKRLHMMELKNRFTKQKRNRPTRW